MKSKSMLTVCFLAFLAACNSGGSRKTVAGQCPAGNYDPVPMKVGPGQEEISLEAQDGKIPEGDYTYEGAILYYNAKNGLRMQIHDVRQRDQTFKSHVACVRNAQRPLNSFVMSGVRTLNVDKVDPKKIVAEVTDYSVHHDTKFVTKSSKAEGKTLQSPAEAYVHMQRKFMVATKGNEVNYEIRSMTSDAHGEYFLKINLKRTKKPQ